MKLTVVGCSPAWPNPGGAQSGYLLEGPGRLLLDCGPGVLARLRSNGTNGWPEVDAIAITHFHLDHWGDLVPWVWGADVGPRAGVRAAGALAPAGRARGAGRVRHALRDAGHVPSRLRAEGVRRGRGVRGGGPHARRDSPAALHGADVRIPRLEQHADACVLGRLRPERATVHGSPRASTSSCARRRSSGASSTASRAATSRPRRPSPRSRPRARSGCCSRTARRSSWTAARAGARRASADVRPRKSAQFRHVR